MKVVHLVLVVLVFANLVVLNYFVFLGKRVDVVGGVVVSPSPMASASLQESVASDGCGEDCMEAIVEEVEKAVAGLPTAEPTSTAGPVVVAKTAVPEAKVSYLPLGSGGTTRERDWADVSGSEFTFDLRDYSSGAIVQWQGNLRSEDSSGRCYARVYDKSSWRGVDFSEQSTNSTSFESLKSQPLAIWWGNNNYVMQMKSLNGSKCDMESAKMIVNY